MKITKFDISNFKGVEHTTISLADNTPGNICTLIGLNESGKTTILEGISNFITKDKDTASLVGTVHERSSLQDLIPKARKAAFTGEISIKATFELDDNDITALAQEFLLKHSLILSTDRIPRIITVNQCYRFEDSRHQETKNLWSLVFYLRTHKSKKYSEYNSGNQNDIWRTGIVLLRGMLPKIVYFPTFLFNIPDRIYLDQSDDEINTYYVQVIQDILDSCEDQLSVKKHIVDRIARLRAEHATAATFMSFLFGKDEKKQVDAVLQKASNEMSRVIFGSWNQISGRNIAGKRVQIDWLLDPEKDNAPYLEIYIVDGQSKYGLSERSLGFRWFFSFLLFTQFRINRKTSGGTIFLFDEPAANLHSKAQIKLLESFSRIANGSTYNIYSTHSHYMVNPLWLEKSYIIENKATDYEKDEDVDSFAVQKTNITAIRYKTFVGSYPTKTTYFQPVLDALEVTFSPLMRSSNAIVVEGKNDYHPLRYFCKSVLRSAQVEIFPGNGAEHSSCLIALFRGWGIKFKVILDDDMAGKKAKDKYIKEMLVTSDEVFTLGEIDDRLSKKVFEDLYQEDVIDSVRTAFGVSAPNKRQFSLFFQELVATNSSMVFQKTRRIYGQSLTG